MLKRVSFIPAASRIVPVISPLLSSPDRCGQDVSCAIGTMAVHRNRGIRWIHFFSNHVLPVDQVRGFPVDIPHVKFPSLKFGLVRDSLQSCIDNDALFSLAAPATPSEILLCHCPGYVERFLMGQLSKQEMQSLGFQDCSSVLVRRVLGSAGATVAAVRHVCGQNAVQVVSDGISKNSRESNCDIHQVGLKRFQHALMTAGHIGGGTHHAFYDFPEGYCVFNDLVIGANIALREYGNVIKKVLIIDLDVHQGNGTAAVVRKLKSISRRTTYQECALEEKICSGIFTFSIHCRNNYFSRVEQSDVDIEVPGNCNDTEYMKNLSDWLPWLFEHVEPDLILYQAGVDVHCDDRLGKTSLTEDGVKQRSLNLYKAIKQYNVAKFENRSEKYCRLVVTMGGGYPKSLDPCSPEFQQVIRMHTEVYLDAYKVFQGNLETVCSDEN